MTTIRAAFYARVSGEQQAAAHTIDSQIAALSERASNDGTPVPPERQFVDDGYSGATLTDGPPMAFPSMCFVLMAGPAAHMFVAEKSFESAANRFFSDFAFPVSYVPSVVSN